MFVANLAALALAHMSTMAAWFFQEQAAVGWDPISLWNQMGIPAKAWSSFCSSCRAGQSAS